MSERTGDFVVFDPDLPATVPELRDAEEVAVEEIEVNPREMAREGLQLAMS